MRIALQASQGISQVNKSVALAAAMVEGITRNIAGISQQSSQVNQGSAQVGDNVASLTRLAARLDKLAHQYKVQGARTLASAYGALE